jgi:hypothetical protein
VQATITVTHSDSSAVVATVSSDAAGQFELALPVGNYVLTATTAMARSCAPLPVEVREGQQTQAIVQCDTGIR